MTSPEGALLRPHLVGCLGQGMAALAGLLVAAGAKPTGSDRLRIDPGDPMHRSYDELGLPIAADVASSLPSDATSLVLGSYIPRDHPLVAQAVQQDLPVLDRLACLSRVVEGRPVLGVSGGAGKSSTAAISHQLLDASARATAYIGASCPHLGGRGYQWSPEGIAVVEACEFGREFLHLSPSVAIVTNVIWGDHADYYRNQSDMHDAFAAFIGRSDQLVVLDDPEVEDCCRRAGRADRVRVGPSPSCEWQITDVRRRPGGTSFRLSGTSSAEVDLPLRGSHNVTNAALAIVAVHLETGEPLDSLGVTAGAVALPRRRVDPLLVGPSGQILVDDYGHNPAQLHAGLDSITQRWPGLPFWAVFQPSVHSRVLLQFEELADALAGFAGCTLLEIQPGSLDDQTAASAVSAHDLAAAIAARGTEAHVARDPAAAGDRAEQVWRTGTSLYVAGSRRAAVLARSVHDRLAT